MTAQSLSRRYCDDAVSNSLDIARDTFTWLVTGPDPVSLADVPDPVKGFAYA